MREGKVSSDRPFARFERAGSRPDPARGSRPRRDEMAAARESAAPRPHRGAIPIDPARDPGDRRGPRTQRGGVSGRDHSGRATTRATETARLERWYGSVPQARTRRPGDTRERRVAAPKDERDPRRRRDTSGPGTTTRPRREERAGAGAKVTTRTSARGGRSYEGAPRREERPGRASAAGAARAAGAGRTTQRQERSGSVRTSNPRRGTPAAPARRPSGRPTKRSGGPRR